MSMKPSEALQELSFFHSCDYFKNPCPNQESCPACAPVAIAKQVEALERQVEELEACKETLDLQAQAATAMSKANDQLIAERDVQAKRIAELEAELKMHEEVESDVEIDWQRIQARAKELVPDCHSVYEVLDQFSRQAKRIAELEADLAQEQLTVEKEAERLQERLREAEADKNSALKCGAIWEEKLHEARAKLREAIPFVQTAMTNGWTQQKREAAAQWLKGTGGDR